MRVRVYRNLHKKCYSIQAYIPGTGWRVLWHDKNLLLDDVSFSVNQNGRRRVLKEKRKSVHAYVVGELKDKGKSRRFKKCGEARYNPYDGPLFTDTTTKKAVKQARIVNMYFDKDGRAKIQYKIK